MRNKSQVVIPLDLEICIPKEDFVFKVAENMRYDERRDEYICPDGRRMKFLRESVNFIVMYVC